MEFESVKVDILTIANITWSMTKHVSQEFL